MSVEIRGEEVTAAVSPVSAVPEVRARLLDLQREVIGAGGIVVEGRDIGSVVWPQAEVKVYLSADPDARAERRAAEQGGTDVASTQQSLLERDRIDSGRATAPLTMADGAVHVDSTHLSLDEVIETDPRPGRGRAPVTGTDLPASSAEHPRTRLLGVMRPIAVRVMGRRWPVTVHHPEQVPASGGVILAANHIGILDGPLLATYAPRPVHALTKREMFDGRLGGFLRATGQIPLDRFATDPARDPDRACGSSATGEWWASSPRAPAAAATSAGSTTARPTWRW